MTCKRDCKRKGISEEKLSNNFRKNVLKSAGKGASTCDKQSFFAQQCFYGLAYNTFTSFIGADKSA